MNPVTTHPTGPRPATAAARAPLTMLTVCGQCDTREEVTALDRAAAVRALTSLGWDLCASDADPALCPGHSALRPLWDRTTTGAHRRRHRGGRRGGERR